MEHVGSLLLGLGNGGVFAALAVALVLTYRSSGVINFATGAIALYVAYQYAALRGGQILILVPGLPAQADIGQELGLVPAVLIALVIAGLLGALLYGAVFRPLREAAPLARAVASLGVLTVIQSTMAIRLGAAPVSVDAIFPDHAWDLGSATVRSGHVYLAVTVVAGTLVLAAIYRFTRFGLLTRAAAQTHTGSFVSGVSPDRMALANWVISAMVAGAAGILIAPLSPLTPITYTLFVVPALAAALVGGFQNLVPTVIAGLLIGMVQAEALSLALEHSWMPRSGSAELVPLLVILVALLLTGQGLPARGGLVRQQLGRTPRPRSTIPPTIVGIVVGVVALLVTDGTWRSAVIGTFIAAIIGLSVVVVTGYAGQVSLAQLALAGAAAFFLSGVTQSWGVPFPFAPLLAALAATGLGVVIGLPALRLRGLTLGIVTLGLAYAIEAVWFRNTQIVSTRGASVPNPKLFGLDLGIGVGDNFPRIQFGLLCLAVLIAVAWGVARLRTSTLGSAMLAVRDNERSAAGIGVNVVQVKLISFALASFIAGIGGSLLAYRRGVVTFDSFTALGGLTLLATAYLAGVTSVFGGILAGVLSTSGVVFVAADKWLDFGDWFTVITGLALILTVIIYPEGLASGGHQLADRVTPALAQRFRRARPAGAVPGVPGTAGDAPTTGDAPAPEPATGGAGTGTPARAPEPAVPVAADAVPVAASAARGEGLAVSGLTVRYGGVVAVSNVSLRVEPGTIVGLIGPNGAGKTSVIDAVTGFASADGTVTLDGSRIDGLPPHQRVRRGLARTFQAIELYEELTVEENVAAAVFGVGRDHRHAAIAEALDLVDIGRLAKRTAGELSQGERQLVSMARACAAKPEVLLLDEPGAGLDTSESVWLGERIRRVSAAGAGVLLIDHDVALVLGVCDYIYVLDFGKLIAEGDPATIRADKNVTDAYLGTVHQAPETTTTTATVSAAPLTASTTAQATASGASTS
ncbi:branched-chain amino acid transport system ATP-binding protein [Frankia sp. AiPs1]|uniref:branched-chain amino acid ABC transporter permease/ATP-binding protein n=1 Tax=Frankia sp. AiPa1 TaxID=573492 RepID=UPI00202AC2E7|nr:branched-chain amino acid ABC transporter permease/ATP-binding protein [Frankia sp. AiPa1]MCL9760002.1 branched-chain amino acid ABC transporter permease/ATP-binding protein [Frankia sp. AiPa1]